MVPSSSPRSCEDRVFDRPLHLAGVLDNAADELSHTFWGYEWNDRTRCNCGVVARQVMQTTSPKLRKLLPSIYADGIFYPTWSSMAGKYCSVTGLSENEVFQRLFAAGMQHEDFSHLEALSHAEILNRMTPYRRETSSVSCSRKSDVIAYLRAWALGIEKFHDYATVKTELVEV